MKTNSVQQANFANVHWFTATNIRVGRKSWGNPMADIDYREVPIDEKDPTLGIKVVSNAKPADDALVYLLRDGWLQSQGVVGVVKADDKMAKAAVEDRYAIIKEYESAEDTASLAVMLRELWFPNGKPIKPEWIANNCYRRSRGIMGVLLRRKRENPANWDHEYIVPVEPKEFGNDTAGKLAKLVDHILENTMKTAGRSELQPVDYFFQAVEMRQLKGDNMRESDLVALHIKRGEAQRAFALVTLDARFPELNIQARCRKEIKPGESYKYEKYSSYIDVASLRHNELVRLVGNKNPSDKLDKVYSRPQVLAMTEKYIENAMVGTKTAAITSRKVIEASSQSPCYLLQYLSKKLEVNDGKWAEVFTAHAKEINKALSFLAKHDEAYAKIAEENVKASE